MKSFMRLVMCMSIMIAWGLLFISFGFATDGTSQAAEEAHEWENSGGIPFPKALEEADVNLNSMNNGQSESLLLGNGDLYGIVWEKEGGLFMRITKNDIWDARVDTSKDEPLPRVEIATGKITGSTGGPPSFKNNLYPQPRCATALRLGPLGSGLQWSCIRSAARYALTPDDDESGAVMEVGGGVEQSTGYKAIAPGTPVASSLEMRLKGSENAHYYIAVVDKSGNEVYKSGWKKSPVTEEKIAADFKPVAVDKIILYTKTVDGKIAENHIREVVLHGADEKMTLTFPKPSALKAHLDIRRAVASISSAGSSETQIRILHDRNVVLVNSAHPVLIDPIKAATLPDAQIGKTDGIDWLLMNMPGDVDYKGMDYAVAVATRGELKAVALVTSFDIKSRDVLKHAIALAGDTIDQEERKLIAVHEKGWESYWSRSGVALDDPELQRWWYRMLYYAGTVCKPGTAPVGIMPPLATDGTPWHADYHHNYNTWQAFYPLPGCNHPELADPWISYINEMLPRFKYLAKETYGIDGVCVPISSFLHEPDPAVCKSKNGRQMSMNPWGLTIGLVGMTIQSMWQKHLYQPDAAYLNAKIYPTLREGAKFYIGFMQQCRKDAQGKILLGPSYSPEHGAVGINNCPFDIAYVHYTFDALIQAAGELKRDVELVAQCRKYKALLGDYPTTIHNGEEIVVDWQGGKYFRTHNITVPAVPVFPGDQVTWFSPESTKELFRNTIKVTGFDGNNSHVMFNIAKARLSMPEGLTDAKKWFVSRELPNGLFVWQGHVHGTFMGEMIGVAGLINEFLLQSVDNKIRLFPCWPKERNAAFAGLRAQGGFLVSAEQKSGAVVKLEIISTVGGRLQLLSPWKTIKVNGKALTPDARGLVTLETKPGERDQFEGE